MNFTEEFKPNDRPKDSKKSEIGFGKNSVHPMGLKNIAKDKKESSKRLVRRSIVERNLNGENQENDNIESEFIP